MARELELAVQRRVTEGEQGRQRGDQGDRLHRLRDLPMEVEPGEQRRQGEQRGDDQPVHEFRERAELLAGREKGLLVERPEREAHRQHQQHGDAGQAVAVAVPGAVDRLELGREANARAPLEPRLQFAEGIQ